MVRIAFVFLASLFSLRLVLFPGIAKAGIFLDAYIGSAYTDNSDIRFHIADTATNDATINTDDGRIIGGRIGYWIDLMPWIGLALDVSYLETQGEAPEIIGDVDLTNFNNLTTVDFKILPVSTLLMLRLPQMMNPLAMVTGINPYIGVGPTLIATQADFEGFSGTGAALGLDARVGLHWEFLPIIGIFA